MVNILRHELQKTFNADHDVNELTRASPGQNSEAAYLACRTRRFLGTHQWQSALFVVGLPVCNLHYDWLEMSCHFSPSLIQLG